MTVASFTLVPVDLIPSGFSCLDTPLLPVFPNTPVWVGMTGVVEDLRAEGGAGVGLSDYRHSTIHGSPIPSACSYLSSNTT